MSETSNDGGSSINSSDQPFANLFSQCHAHFPGPDRPSDFSDQSLKDFGEEQNLALTWL